MAEPVATAGIDRLKEVMARLRDPRGGCPWDREQTFETIAPYTIEEAYEVADAIARQDWADLRSELGDLLLQVVYHAQIAAEEELFNLDAVIEAITEKMIRRHPHVFGDASVADATAQSEAWEKTKALERLEKSGSSDSPPSILDDVPLAQPALTRAIKLQRRAARTGFDWPDALRVMAKVEEELGELQHELTAGNEASRVEEFGDLLFSLANLARHLEIDAEAALRHANSKFERRFRELEGELRPTSGGARLPIEELEEVWQRIKARERQRANSPRAHEGG
jgi:nucleoside triphosphate diphosphatase